MSQANGLKPVWASFPGSVIRHKVFVPSSIVNASDVILEAARGLFFRFTLDEKKFPIRIQVFGEMDSAEPLGEMLVGLTYKDVDDDLIPVFHQSQENSKP